MMKLEIVSDPHGEAPDPSLEFAAFFDERFAALSRLAFLLTDSATAADEIAQDACEQVFRRWTDIEHPRTYARTAVINGARSWGRRRSLRRRTPGDPTRHTEFDSDTIAVRQALKQLPEREREVIVLRYYADLKVDDIAADLDIPVGTVKSLIHRSLSQLQEALR